MVTVYIAVMDYCLAEIRMFNAKFKSGWQTEDVEDWLDDNDPNWQRDQCYYMCSTNQIEVNYGN